MSRGLQSPTSAVSRRRAAPRCYRGLACVRLRADLPEKGLRRGEVGTVVHVFETADAYLVEFIDEVDGSTKALAELEPDQLAPA